ncbi:MAG: hypothetical protein ACOC91_02945 [bacterium]
MVERVMRKIAGGSIFAVVTGLLAAFGLFWLGIALHHALLPELGAVWAWVVPGALYLLLAFAAAAAALRRSSAQPQEGAPAVPPFPASAGQLGMELGREVEREVRRHPLRAVSLAMLGGAALGASPELRRSLFGLAREAGAGPDTGSRRSW